MKDDLEPELKKQDGAEKELPEETLYQVSGGRRVKAPLRMDVEIEGDSRFEPQDIRKPTKIVDL